MLLNTFLLLCFIFQTRMFQNSLEFGLTDCLVHIEKQILFYKVMPTKYNLFFQPLNYFIFLLRGWLMAYFSPLKDQTVTFGIYPFEMTRESASKLLYKQLGLRLVNHSIRKLLLLQDNVCYAIDLRRC